MMDNYFSPYYVENMSRALYRHFTTVKRLDKLCVVNCLLKDSRNDDCLMLTGKLFQAVGPAVRNARSTKSVFVDRVV